MKTPRELYLEKHQAMGPRLDRLRAGIVKSELAKQAPSLETRPGFLSELRRELIGPGRKLIVALAPVWLIILLLQAAARQSDSSRLPAAASEMPAFLREQRQLMAEIETWFPNPEAPPTPADKPRSAAIFFRFT